MQQVERSGAAKDAAAANVFFFLPLTGAAKTLPAAKLMPARMLLRAIFLFPLRRKHLICFGRRQGIFA
jgi:hypothetical protein